MEDVVYPKVQLDVADVNHVELNNVDEPFDAFRDWPTAGQVTSKERMVCTKEEDRKRHSDSFSDEWQDYTSEVSISDFQVTPQHKSLELHDTVAQFDAVDFMSLSKTIFSQCFHSSNYDNSFTYKEKFNPQNDL